MRHVGRCSVCSDRNLSRQELWALVLRCSLDPAAAKPECRAGLSPDRACSALSVESLSPRGPPCLSRVDGLGQPPAACGWVGPGYKERLSLPTLSGRYHTHGSVDALCVCAFVKFLVRECTEVSLRHCCLLWWGPAGCPQGAADSCLQHTVRLLPG